MKKRTLIAPFLIALFTLSTACSNEPLTEEPLAATPTEPTQKEPVQTNGETPCDFNLSNLGPNDTVIIDCLLDLGGETINIPSGVTIEYQAGGDMINGTLNFSDNGIISGELLNESLKLTGSTPSLKDPTFNFIPSRWGIVEGETTSEIAQENNFILEGTMFKIKDMGGSTFKIGDMDAYFEVSKVTSTTTNQNFYPQKEAINIPSDFTLEMTNNTILRVFPTENTGSAALIGLDDVSNTTIKGGILFGDRDLRQYTSVNQEAGAHLITIRSGKNIVLDGITMTMGSHGGLNINSYGFTFNPDYNPSNNILVKNCTFSKNRILSIAITDGYNITIDNNTFLDTAQATSKSDGGVVGFAIDLEPVRTRDSNTGELINYQSVHDVTIKNNTEKNSREGSFTIYIGDNIIIENNTLENGITWSFASNSKVRNNTFNSPPNENKPAIYAGGYGETVFGNEISGNTINGYPVGIGADYRDINIFDNKLNDCTTGIQLKESNDMRIYNNTIINKNSTSRGIMAHIANCNNVEIYNNNIDVLTNSFYFVQLNRESAATGNLVSVHDNNILNGIPIFSNSQGVIFNNNIINVGLQIANSSDIEILNSVITTSNSDGIYLMGENLAINLANNDINYNSSTNYQCINISSNTDPTEISNLETNTCN